MTNETIALSLLDASPEQAAVIVPVLRKFGNPALRCAERARIRIRPLRPGETYAQASPVLRRLRLDVDRRPHPPAGLFIVDERTVYLRSCSPMTVAHEFGHALDCALGDGTYHSAASPAVRAFFRRAVRFVTPYAGVGIDEYFAECMRAYVNVNDPTSPWPQATRRKLRRVDPDMHAYLHELFSRDFGVKTQPASVAFA